MDIIHLHGVRCITSVDRIKFARFEHTDSNVRKRLREVGCPSSRFLCLELLLSIPSPRRPPIVLDRLLRFRFSTDWNVSAGKGKEFLRNKQEKREKM